MSEWPDCIDCGEPGSGSCPEGRCLDCDIRHLIASAACRECGVTLYREEYAGSFASQHREGCSARVAAELAVARQRAGL